jgi:hypothetical protein
MRIGSSRITAFDGRHEQAWNPVLLSRFITIILLVFLATIPVAAHPISMTTAEAEVKADSIRVTMRVMVEDLVLFHALKSNGTQRYAAEDLRRAAGDHRDFIMKFFSIRDSKGNAIGGRVSGMDVSSIPDDGVARIDLMKLQVVYTLEYARSTRENGEPFLTFTQNFGGEKALVPAVMDLTVTQNGIWLDRPVQIPAGKPHTVAFDWENPPDQPPKNWRELKQQKEQEFQRRLGITSYTGIYSYIYVTEREVRHEILVPLLTFEEWLPLPRSDPEFLAVDEQQRAREPISEFLRHRNPVEINGAVVEPILERLQFFGLDINDFARNAEPRRVGVYQARLGIILSYPVSHSPQNVKMTWNTFSVNASALKSFVYVDQDKPAEQFFEKDKATWQWQRQRQRQRQRQGRQEPASVNESSSMWLPIPPKAVFLPSYVNIALLAAALCWLGIALIGRRKRSALAAGITAAALGAGLSFGVTVPTQQIEESDARQIIDRLLPQVYRAFEHHSEEAIYDALAESLDGEMLDAMSFAGNLK